MAAILDFMDSPLVTWLQSFASGGCMLQFQELCDGAFLNDVFLQIENNALSCLVTDSADRETPQNDKVLRSVKDVNGRLRNWALLLHNIINFYQEMLGQIVTMPLPDILSVAKDPLKDGSLVEMQKLLLLLLGCAVQCTQKETYINSIKTMPLKLQQDLVVQIQQITDDPCTVISQSSADNSSVSIATWTALSQSLANERHFLNQRVTELHEECNYLRAEIEGQHGSLSPPETLDAFHMSKDLNTCRNQLNQLTSDLEERSKQLAEQKDEFDQMKVTLNKLNHQNALLSKEAKLARSYRDEIEEYREEAGKIQQYENEIKAYKEKMLKLKFFETRVEELTQDNDSLMELRGKLEEQVNATQKRAESVMDELIRTQLQMEDAIQERDSLSQRVQCLEDQPRLSSSSLSLAQRGGSMRRMLSYASSDFLTGSHLQLNMTSPPKGGTISDELKESIDSRVTQIEAENDLLKENLTEAVNKLEDTEKELERLRADSQKEIQKKMSELELQTKELRKKTKNELSKEFESKVLEIEQRSLKLKERVAQEFQQRIKQLEERNQQLQLQSDDSRAQMQLVHEAINREKEMNARTEKRSKDLVDEREHVKEQILILKESHGEKVRALERQVDAYRNKAEEMEKMAAMSRAVVARQGSENRPPNHDSPARISYVADSPQKQRKCSSENCRKKERRPRSASTNHYDPNSVQLQRHASVIGIPTEPCRVQRGKEFEHHHHHFHHHHFHGPDPTRSAPTTPTKSAPPPLHSSFNRGDRLRSSVQVKSRPVSEHQPFVRNSRMHSTMPERRKCIPMSHSAPQTLERKKSMILDSDVKRYPVNGMESSSSTSSMRSHYYTDTDSGCASSPDHSASPESSNPSEHLLTGFEVFSTETIQTQLRFVGTNGAYDKWKVFVDKIVDLQNRNQHLSLENSEMRRTMKTIRGTSDRLDALETLNLKLEVENRKLRRICDSLQSSLVNKKQYDQRLYHFYSNV